MKQIWTRGAVRAASKYGEQAPMVTACCNACRTCVTTNVVGLMLAGLGAAVLSARRFGRRLAGKDAADLEPAA